MADKEYRNIPLANGRICISSNETIEIKTKLMFSKPTESTNGHFCKKNSTLSAWLEYFPQAIPQTMK